jgi:hypothetical protein
MNLNDFPKAARVLRITGFEADMDVIFDFWHSNKKSFQHPNTFSANLAALTAAWKKWLKQRTVPAAVVVTKPNRKRDDDDDEDDDEDDEEHGAGDNGEAAGEGGGSPDDEDDGDDDDDDEEGDAAHENGHGSNSDARMAHSPMRQQTMTKASSKTPAKSPRVQTPSAAPRGLTVNAPRQNRMYGQRQVPSLTTNVAPALGESPFDLYLRTSNLGSSQKQRVSPIAKSSCDFLSSVHPIVPFCGLHFSRREPFSSVGIRSTQPIAVKESRRWRQYHALAFRLTYIWWREWVGFRQRRL